MTPLHAWLRGLSSDSCGVFRGAWATDAGNFERKLDYAYTFGRFPCELRQVQPDALTNAIADQRRGEVVGRWSEEA